MKKVRNFVAVILNLSLILCMFTACGNNGATSDGEVVVLKAGHVLSEEGHYQVGLEAMKKYMEEKTDGKFTLEIYPNSQLGDERALFEGTQLGTVDIACGATSVLSNFDPSFTIFDLPYLFDNRDHAFAALDSEAGQAKLDNLKQYNMIGLAYYDTGFFEILNSKKAINNLADAKGLTIRTVENSVFIEYMNAIGVNPNPMAWTDAYLAMQNGTIDGTCNPIGPIYNTKVYEICQNYARTEAIYGPIVLTVSKQKYDSLSPEYQQILKDAAKASVAVEREFNVNREDQLLSEMEDAGLKVTYPDKEEFKKASVEKVYAQFVGDIVSAEEVEAFKNIAY